MIPDANSKNDNFQADIVVVGGGGAGLPAAIAAAEQGVKNVIVVEKRIKLGGNGVFPAGLFASESRLQKRLDMDAQNEKIFADVMDYTHWKANPRLVRALLDRSGETIDWLEEKGVKFTDVIPHYPNQAPAFFHVSSGRGPTGNQITKALTTRGENLGVRFLCQAEAKKIITDKEKNITGIMVKTREKEFLINTGCIIIATGGYAGNTGLIKQYLPTYEEMEMLGGGIAHKGDGLRMAAEIGAAIDGMAVLEMAAPFAKISRYSSPLFHRPNTIWVNLKGERFTNETVVYTFSEAANAVFNQPGKTTFVLLDDNIKNQNISDGLGAFEDFSLGEKTWQENIYKEIRSDTEKGNIMMSDSWEEIAQWIGVNDNVLKNTISEYNSCCDQGYDNIFTKDRRYLLPLRTPPYYAIKCGIGLITTHGGIKINHRMEALDNLDNSITGLYAAGVETGGTDSDTYNVGLSGHSYSFSINSGRIAGENAAKYILHKKK